MLRAKAAVSPTPRQLNQMAPIPRQCLRRGSNLAPDDFTVAEPNIDIALERTSSHARPGLSALSISIPTVAVFARGICLPLLPYDHASDDLYNGLNRWLGRVHLPDVHLIRDVPGLDRTADQRHLQSVRPVRNQAWISISPIAIERNLP